MKTECIGSSLSPRPAPWAWNSIHLEKQWSALGVTHFKSSIEYPRGKSAAVYKAETM